MTTKIQELHEQGQSVWYDNISRDLITTGALQKLIDIINQTIQYRSERSIPNPLKAKLPNL